MTVEVRPATREDLLRYFEKDRLGPSVKAIAGIVDGRIVGVGGIAFMGGRPVAFCDLKDEARPYRKTLHKAALGILGEAKRRHRLIVAFIDRSEPTAERWIERLGFRHFDGDTYMWRRDWQTSD